MQDERARKASLAAVPLLVAVWLAFVLPVRTVLDAGVPPRAPVARTTSDPTVLLVVLPPVILAAVLLAGTALPLLRRRAPGRFAAGLATALLSVVTLLTGVVFAALLASGD